MQSNQIVSFNKQTDEVEQLRDNIKTYISTLQENIKKEKASPYYVSERDIAIWNDKIAVLEIALLCLLGEKNFDDLNSATNQHNKWDKNWINNSQTKSYVEQVKTFLILSSFSSYDNSRFSLLFPSDLQLYFLVNYLYRLTDIISFARTSKSHYVLFHKNTATLLLCPALDHVARGEYDVARKIYSKNPTILTMKGKTSYHPHRYCYVNQTNFQIALRNAEYKEAEKIGQYLSPEERQKQFNEIFPDGQLVSGGCNLETAKSLLKDVYNAIIVDDVIREANLDLMSEKTRSVLKLLQDAVNPEKYKECQKGLVFDMQIYLEALSLYDSGYFGNKHRKTFWCVRVEGLIASCFPTFYLRVHCQGIGNVVGGNVVKWDKLSGRGCTLGDGSSYFNRNPNDLPSIHFFVGCYGEPKRKANGWGCRWQMGESSRFLTLIEQLQKEGERLYAEIFPNHQLMLQ